MACAATVACVIREHVRVSRMQLKFARLRGLRGMDYRLTRGALKRFANYGSTLAPVACRCVSLPRAAPSSPPRPLPDAAAVVVSPLDLTAGRYAFMMRTMVCGVVEEGEKYCLLRERNKGGMEGGPKLTSLSDALMNEGPSCGPNPPVRSTVSAVSAGSPLSMTRVPSEAECVGRAGRWLATLVVLVPGLPAVLVLALAPPAVLALVPAPPTVLVLAPPAVLVLVLAPPLAVDVTVAALGGEPPERGKAQGTTPGRASNPGAAKLTLGSSCLENASQSNLIRGMSTWEGRGTRTRARVCGVGGMEFRDEQR